MSRIWITSTYLGQACLKIQGEGNSHEFSLAFDNSAGAFGDNYIRNQFALFHNLTNEIEEQDYDLDAERFLERLASYLGYKLEKPDVAIDAGKF